MTEEFNESQAQTQEIEAPQEQEQTETVQETPQAEAQTEQTSEVVEASTDNQEQVEQTDGKPQPFIEGLTYTSQEELVKGVKAKDEYIEKLKTDLQAKQQAEQEVYKQLGYQNESQFKNAQVEQQIAQVYNANLENIVAPYMRYVPEDVIVNTIDDIVDLLPGKLAADLTMKVSDLNKRLEFTRQDEYAKAAQAQTQQFEQQKNSLYDSHKDHKELIDLFYDPQPTIEKAIAMKQAIATQAVEAYKASLQATEQNKADIAKLPKANGATVDGQPKTDYSAAELSTLAETDPEAFAKWCRS